MPAGKWNFRLRFFPRSFIGPLGRWELIRLARRGHASRARLLVLYVLMIAVIVTPILWFSNVDPISLFTDTGPELTNFEMMEWSQVFSLGLLEAILAAVAAMMPAFAASSIAEEKEQQTLLLLLTTPLSDREIVLGKAAGRIVFVLAAAAAGIPVLMASMLFGGVSIEFLLGGCCLIVSTGILAGAIGIHSACATPDSRSAFVRAYVITCVCVCGAFIPPFVLLSPFGVLTAMLDQAGSSNPLPPVASFIYAGVQVGVAGLFLFDAIRLLRGERLIHRSAVKPKREELFAEAVAVDEQPKNVLYLDYHALTARLYELPPVDESDPIRWKERWAHKRGEVVYNREVVRTVRLLLAGFAVILMAIGCIKIVLQVVEGWFLSFEMPEPSAFSGPWMLLVGGTILMGLYYIPVAVALAATVARERHRQTLDALLVLPLDRRSILASKVFAILEREWMWYPVAVLAAAVAFGAEVGWMVGLAVLLHVLAGGVLVVGLGAYWTVRRATPGQAFRFLIAVVVVVIGTPVGFWTMMSFLQPNRLTLAFVVMATVEAAVGFHAWRRACRAMDTLAHELIPGTESDAGKRRSAPTGSRLTKNID